MRLLAASAWKPVHRGDSNEPGGRQILDIGAHVQPRINPISRINDVNFGFIQIPSVPHKHDMAADFLLGRPLDEQDGDTWNVGDLADWLIYRAGEAKMRQQTINQRFGYPPWRMSGKFKLVDGELAHVIERLAGNG